MQKWLGGARGALLLVVLWTLGWGLGFGGFAEVLDSAGEILDVWPTVMAIPGFIGGVVFALVWLVAERGRSVDQVSSTRLVAWGALSGLAIGAVAAAVKLNPPLSLTLLQLTCVFAALGAIAGFGTAVFAWFFSHGGHAAVHRMG